MSIKGIIDATLFVIIGFILFGLIMYLLILLGVQNNYQWLSFLGFAIYPLFRRYDRIGWHSIKTDIENARRNGTEFVKSLFYLIAFFAIAGLMIWTGYKIIVKTWDFITPDTWTLMVCSTKLNYAECKDNSYEIPGFKSQKECMLEGADRFSREGFECGKNCYKEGTLGLNICKEVCNKAGCSK